MYIYNNDLTTIFYVLHYAIMLQTTVCFKKSTSTEERTNSNLIRFVHLVNNLMEICQTLIFGTKFST